jgi:hypothetical protein
VGKVTLVGKVNINMFWGRCDKVFRVDLSLSMAQFILFCIHEKVEKRNITICAL